MMRQETGYQITLIAAAIIGTVLFGLFFVREIYPEYKIYQQAYVDLEVFRSSYTGSAPPPFQMGVKQIVIPKSDKGPETIDRCISCHVALQFEHFSPTVIAKSVDGDTLTDENGNPRLEPNPDYVWAKLNERIEALRKEGKGGEADELEGLKTAFAGEHEYDMEKVLQMHPLIGRETRPFEYHPIDEYGCTVCHGGNGRGLTTDRAHGAIYDSTYEESFMGPKPQFLEEDPENDPKFSKVFNEKPGERLIFQTKPLLVGNLIQSSCVQCHKPTDIKIENSIEQLNALKEAKKTNIKIVQASFENEYNALISLLSMRKLLLSEGLSNAISILKGKSTDYTLSKEEREKWASNARFLDTEIVSAEGDSAKEKELLRKINNELLAYLGSKELVEKLQTHFDSNLDISEKELKLFLEENSFGKGSLGLKKDALVDTDLVAAHKELFSQVKENLSLKSNVDRMTLSYQRGKELFISQACYACHRIAGFARGGIGPELTTEGEKDPWFVKESIVWPQGDLKTSTMPNYRLDHDEIEDLMTFLLAQRQETQADSLMSKRVQIKAWEEGKKTAVEEKISPDEIRDIRKSMTVFASQGCAACHRLNGYESNIGFTIEKEDPSFDALYAEKEWFRKIFPEDVSGSEIIQRVEKHRTEIERRIVTDVRSNSILEEIDRDHKELIESFYSNFKFALRGAKDPLIVQRVLMMYVQEYGLGRQIGPRPNWSGVYRSDKWLMEHFWNPSSLVSKSIMPVFPFDNTKFLALTYMLNELGRKNSAELREVWSNRGFEPEMAYETLCAQCHGDNLKGNGPVSEWIYPIPKNLGNPVFLRNLTKERAFNSITHGIVGGPMAPWGEAANGERPVLTKEEVRELVNWIYRKLPGERYLRDQKEIKKWDYSPEDVIEELKKTGDDKKLQSDLSTLLKFQPLIAATKPEVSTNELLSVQTLFDVLPASDGGIEDKRYYIKERFYTPENLQAGKEFFKINCAVCHGNDADGAGTRAEVMEDAKPRNLINLPWIESRDDLRLMRSLVFGVQGTAMNAWGNQTTALQRLQLIMYIRSLTDSKRNFERLKNVLYENFQATLWKLEQMSSKSKVATGMIPLIESQKTLFQDAGKNLFSLYGDTTLFDEYLSLIQKVGKSVVVEGTEISLNPLELQNSEKGVVNTVKKNISYLQKEIKYAKGQISTTEKKEEINDLESRLALAEELYRELIYLFAESKRIYEQQAELIKGRQG